MTLDEDEVQEFLRIIRAEPDGIFGRLTALETVPAGIPIERPDVAEAIARLKHSAAAERVTRDMWVCKTCRQGWPVEGGRDPTFDPERAARACHTGHYPCCAQGCDLLTVRQRTLCPKHMAEHEADRRDNRKVEPWNGLMIWSEELEQFFEDVGEAESRAMEDLGDNASPEDIRGELERYDLVLCIQRKPPVFEVTEFLSDWMPDDDHGRDPLGVESACAAEVAALNKAIQALPAVYQPTNTRLDLNAQRKVKQ